MKNYELTYLITPDASAEEAKALSEKIAGFVAQAEAAILTNTDPAKINLAYPIEKKQEAWLVSFSFSLLPEKIKEIKEKVSSENQVLRHMIISKAKENRKAKKIRQLAEHQPQKEENSPAQEKVEIEKIDQKIDEILK